MYGWDDATSPDSVAAGSNRIHCLFHIVVRVRREQQTSHTVMQEPNAALRAAAATIRA